MFEKLAASLPFEIQQEFKRALKKGYWSNGMKLTAKQRKSCKQALFIYEGNSQQYIH